MKLFFDQSNYSFMSIIFVVLFLSYFLPNGVLTMKILRVCSALPVPNFLLSFFTRTFFKLLNGVFFCKKFYTKVA
jgi:hypothetical protein